MAVLTAKPEGETLTPPSGERSVYLAVLLALGLSHLLNDTVQSLIPAIYPVLAAEFSLDLASIGLITLVFQIAGALFQPAIGLYTDRNPLPYSGAVGMVFTLLGLTGLAFVSTFPMVLVSVALVGVGSSVFHPEATRSARYAAGGRQGLAQGVFQLGGQIGGALGPLCAAFVIVARGRASLAAFTAVVVLAMALLFWTGRQQGAIRTRFEALAAGRAAGGAAPQLSRATVAFGLGILTVLMTSKLSYLESFRSFYTFYLIDRFGVSVQTSQLMLFVIFISSAAGVLLGGLVGDRIGRYGIIWISIVGPLPFTLLLPSADLPGTVALTVMINLVMASGFPSIMIYAMDLVPRRIGLIGGLFYGLNFAIGGVAAACLGVLSDGIGIASVYRICSFLPAVGLLTVFLPRLPARR